MATSLLLADDSPTIARILQMALQAEPYDIRSVLTAEAALKELKANPPDLFLVDLALPEKNGYDFARLIRKDPALKKTHVVILASAFDPVNESEIKASGAHGVITKPFDPADLRAKLRGVLEASALLPKAIERDTRSSLQAPPPENGDSDVDMLLDESPGESGDADSILSGILGGAAPPPRPEITDTPSKSLSKTGFTNATVMLDLEGKEEKIEPHEHVLDLSDSFERPGSGSTFAVPGVTGKTKAPAVAPALAAPPAPPEAEPLSANAQALAAFFEAEIDSQDKGPGAPLSLPEEGAPVALSEEDAFDASLSSIEWTSPADASLNAWSSSAPKGKVPAAPAPPPAAPPSPKQAPSLSQELSESVAYQPPPSPARPAANRQAAPAPAKEPARGHAPRSSLNTGAGAEGASLFFDTGGSNFRFAEDYVSRITRSFTGAPQEEVPEKHQNTPPPRSLFPQHSDDAPSRPEPAAAPGVGGGAWSSTDVQRIEQIVREEVQMVVREVAEKVVWEVIPELAENIIRKELERVMQEMEKQ